jgi:hypothetical protein
MENRSQFAAVSRLVYIYMLLSYLEDKHFSIIKNDITLQYLEYANEPTLVFK